MFESVKVRADILLFFFLFEILLKVSDCIIDKAILTFKLIILKKNVWKIKNNLFSINKILLYLTF